MFYCTQNQQYIQEGNAFEINGVQYPSNWLNLSTPEEKAEMRRQRQERLALMAAGDGETGATDVTNEEPPLQESFVNNLVMNILSEIKK